MTDLTRLGAGIVLGLIGAGLRKRRFRRAAMELMDFEFAARPHASENLTPPARRWAFQRGHLLARGFAAAAAAYISRAPRASLYRRIDGRRRPPSQEKRYMPSRLASCLHLWGGVAGKSTSRAHRATRFTEYLRNWPHTEDW